MKKTQDQRSPVAITSRAGVAEFRSAAKSYGEKTTASKQAARKALKRIGILTPAGKLAAPYK